MWTRGPLAHAYTANLVVPWNVPTVPCARGGRHAGWFPGYGAREARGAFVGLSGGLLRQGEVVPGFGYACDPSDARTWRRGRQRG